jgi:integrase
MAGLEERGGRYNIILHFGGKRFVRSLKTTDQDEALSRKLRVEENVRLVASGRLQIPDGADVATFLLSDGKLTEKPVAKTSLSLSQLFTNFFDTLPEGSLEQSTIDVMQIHRRHLERIIGKRFCVQKLSHNDLQEFVRKRSRDKTRSGTVTGTTIRKEVLSFRTVWGWGVDAQYLRGVFPNRKLRFPKVAEPPLFQTWEEIERQIANGASHELWDALYLDMSEIGELLKYVKEADQLPCIYAMFAFAAYTGARRSEILRSQLSDIDFESKVITLREKKRVRGKTSTRRVPMSTILARILRQWIKQHPGGAYTFCQFESNPLTKGQAAHYFKQTLLDSSWKVIKGWHCLRHSFISNCASKGIDQRMIDEWVGHSTESMRRRYRHLFPSSQQDAMKRLFR